VTRRRLLLVAGLAVLALGLVASSPAAAQNQSANGSLPETAEQIDRDTTLISAEYDEESGEAVVTLESNTLQDITLSDAGAFVAGGEVRQRTVTVRPDERVTIRMPVTKTDGYTGVSIATRQTLYAVPIETSADMFSGSATWETAQAAAVGGGVGVLALTGVIAWRMRSGGRSKRRRIA